VEISRPQTARRLRDELKGPAPALLAFLAPEGTDRQRIVGEAATGLNVIRYWAAPLLDAEHRALFVERLGRWREPPRQPAPPTSSEPLATTAGWGEIFDHLLARAADRTGPIRIVLEEYARLALANPRLSGEVERFWSGARARSLPIYLVLTGEDAPEFERLAEAPATGASLRRLTVGPLTYREVGTHFPSYSPKEKLTAWAIFGGLAEHLSDCDPETSVATNVRQILLSPRGSLLLEGIVRLERDVQSPTRYTGLLRALANGVGAWGSIRAAAPDLASAGQIAPYVTRLQQLGRVVGETSLDAASGSRSRRYRIADPLLWFWYRFVLPNLSELMQGRGAEVWRERIRPRMDEHVSSLFAFACREYLRHYAHEKLPSDAREVGGLWGAGYDIPLAGTFRTGAAFYGRAHWARGRMTEAVDQRLAAEVRRTRYGFAREARLRVLFSTDGFSPALLRRVARADDVYVIGIESLFAA
jgi:uncharacterized protein